MSFWEQLAILFSYPEDDYAEQLEVAERWLADLHPELAERLAPFADWVKHTRLEEIQEHFTATFDMTASGCLEVGWHLYGESYSRGAFLVWLRGVMRDVGIEESAELPDHMSHVLAVLGRLSPDDAAALAATALPAVDKMIAGQPEAPGSPASEARWGGACPTRALLETIRQLFVLRQELPERAGAASEEALHA